MKRLALCLAFSIIAASFASLPAAPIPAVASSIGKAVAKYFGREGTAEAAEFLTQKGGREIVERVSKRASEEGGEAAVKSVAALTGKYGPEALSAIDNAPAIAPVLRAIDELPESQVSAALTSLAAGAPGKELAEAVGRYGTAALRTELAHPGVGLVMVKHLGDDGAELAMRLSGDQVITFGRHAKDIAKLPNAQREGVLSLMRNQTDRMTRFVGGFVEDNPGKILFSVAATTVILAEPERILGGDEVVFDAEGHPIVMSKAGVVGRSMDAGGEAASHVSDKFLQPLFLAAMVFGGVFAGIWMITKLWHLQRRERSKTRKVLSRE